MKKAQEEAFT